VAAYDTPLVLYFKQAALFGPAKKKTASVASASRPSHICSPEDLTAIVANQQIGDRGSKSPEIGGFGYLTKVEPTIPEIRATGKPVRGQVAPPVPRQGDRGF
jgi:hypothetical protein